MPERASFRDPAGQLLQLGGRVLRVVGADSAAEVVAVLDTDAVRGLVEEGKLVATTVLDGPPAALAGHTLASGSLVLEHPAVEFPSYPYEWPPELLYDAGRLTLEIARRLLEHGLGLKDATPFNVLFSFTGAVFVDVLSVERRDPLDPIWLPYAQFARSFLLPLAVSRHLGLSLQRIFLTSRDGLEPSEVYGWCGWPARLRPPFLGLVTLPAWLSPSAEASGRRLYSRRESSPEKARFVLGSLLARTTRALARLEPGGARSSSWSSYTDVARLSSDELRIKGEFVEQVVARSRIREVLDVGCNTGHFSLLAARAGARVVAIDSDAVVVGRLYRAARAAGAGVLPLVVDFSRPSPATGWRNAECRSFLQRARGRFDLVLMLAVVHHLAVTERVPLPELAGAAAELTRSLLLIEFVAFEDPQFQSLLRGRDALHRDWTFEAFARAFASSFELLERRECSKTRSLCLMRRTDPAPGPPPS